MLLGLGFIHLHFSIPPPPSFSLVSPTLLLPPLLLWSPPITAKHYRHHRTPTSVERLPLSFHIHFSIFPKIVPSTPLPCCSIHTRHPQWCPHPKTSKSSARNPVECHPHYHRRRPPSKNQKVTGSKSSQTPPTPPPVMPNTQKLASHQLKNQADRHPHHHRWCPCYAQEVVK